ncbi:phage tail tape measure protein [Pontibacter beigongshangensis]|uniref:phage tail tape measure protein n=1 Tax=Pontibacter beigongshangensis TaxID=2574733 RepID=UPI00165073F6|nr:phage tail tape measure protein [Pontibacter beigongshangensis]
MGTVRQEIDLDLTGTIQGLQRTAALMGEVTDKTQAMQTSGKSVFSGVAASTESYNKSLNEGVQSYRKIDQAAQNHQKTVQRLDSSMQSLDNTLKTAGKEGAAGLDRTDKAATKLDKSIMQLKIKMDSYKAIVEKATDTRIITKYNQKLEETEKQISQLTNRGKKGFDEMGNAIEKVGGLQGMMVGIGTGIAAFFAVDKILSFAGGVSDTNEQVIKLRASIASLTGAQGDGLDELTAKLKGVADAYGKDYQEVLLASNAAAKAFGITQIEALQQIENGFLAGADAGGDLLDQVREYAPQFQAAGASADELISVISQSAEQGIFSDKGADVVKEFGLRIREQTKATSEALQNAFGKEFTDKLFKGINDGSISTVDALKTISEGLDNTALTAQETQTVITDVFGGPGEDAGLEYIKSLQNIKTSSEDLIDTTSEFVIKQRELTASYTELAATQNELAKETADISSAVKLGLNNALNATLKFVMQVIAVLRELPSFLKENKEAFYALGVALIALNAANIKTAATTIYYAAVEKARTAATKGAAAAQWLLNAAMTANPIGLVVAGVAALVGGLVLLYKNSEKARAVMMGLWQVLKDVGEIAYLTFETLANPSRIVVNFAKIKELGAGLGDAFTKGYNESIAKDAAKKEKEEKAANARKLKETEANAQKEALATNKARIKANKEASKEELAERKKALQDLYKELEKLENEAAKARLDMLDKNSEAYLKAVLEAELKQIDALVDSIEKQQKLAGKPVGLSVEQQVQVNALSLAANKRYFDALTKMQEDERAKILETQKDSDVKEMAQLEAKYDAQIRAALEASKKELAIALEVEKEREKIALRRNQQERRINQNEEFDTALAENTLPDTLSRVQAEELLQERLLQIQIKANEERLALVANSADKEDQIRALQLENEINRLNQQLGDLQASRNKFSLQKLLGLDDEQMDAVKYAIGETLGQLQNFLAETVAMHEKQVQGLTQAIDEKGRELDREILLNEQGFASNVETKQQEYNILKQQREQAFRDQQKAQRAQIALDSAMQASNLITASTEIYAVMAPLGPVGLAGAIALIATMFGTFLAAKARALQSTTVPTFAKGGGFEIKGAKHSQGGVGLYDNVTGKEIAQYEGNEYLYAVNSKATAKHLKLLEAINGDNQKAIVRYALDDLLMGTGVMMNPELPERLQTLQAESKTAHAKPAQAKLPAEIIKHLGTIAKNTAPTPERIETPEFTILKSGNRTRTIRK